MVIGAVQQFLDHGLRGAGRAGDAGVSSVQVDAGSEQVDRDVPAPRVRDRVVVALHVQAVP